MSSRLPVPGSPGKSTNTLQRSNAVTSMTFKAPIGREVPDQAPDRGRSNFVANPGYQPLGHPSSPGKENHPFPDHSKRMRYGAAFEDIRAPSPSENQKEHVKEKKSRARSVSPSKGMRFLQKSKTNAVELEHEHQEKQRDVRQIDHDYVEMLNTMQVPAALMHKLMTLDARVKESMLKGQASQISSSLKVGLSGKGRSAIPDSFMRSKSSMTLYNSTDEEYQRKSKFNSQSRSASGESNSSMGGGSSSSHSKVGIGMHTNSSSISLAASMRSRSTSFSGKDSSIGPNGLNGIMSAPYYATMLKVTDSSRLDVAKVKKMRAVLSSESPSWLTEFFEEGGYQAMLFRLKELLEMEWREEQHDDQLLHELLRCFVALTSTDCGRNSLTSTSPTPFVNLADLLFSEKRPGELSTRKLLVELLSILPELPVPGEEEQKRIIDVSMTRVSSSLLTQLEQAKSSLHFTLLVTLLHNIRDPNQEAIVDFISATHTPRPFKGLVTELLNINRDYFWVFCHSSNRFWALQDVNVDQAQAPKVPGGMTGGVEFEAMSYLTAHVRLINLIARRLLKIGATSNNPSLAKDFHVLLFASGIERLFAITRKASQTYYQELHLELARYFDLTRRSGFRLPVELEAWQSVPQLLPITTLMPSDRTFRPSGESKSDSDSKGSTSSNLMLPLADLGPPLFNPHAEPSASFTSGDNNSAKATLVGDAIKRWEQRVVVTKNGDGQQQQQARYQKQPPLQQQMQETQQQSNERKYNWSPPKEWS